LPTFKKCVSLLLRQWSADEIDRPCRLRAGRPVSPNISVNPSGLRLDDGDPEHIVGSTFPIHHSETQVAAAGVTACVRGNQADTVCNECDAVIWARGAVLPRRFGPLNLNTGALQDLCMDRNVDRQVIADDLDPHNSIEQTYFNGFGGQHYIEKVAVVNRDHFSYKSWQCDKFNTFN
jgi:hypothetical protein